VCLVNTAGFSLPEPRMNPSRRERSEIRLLVVGRFGSVLTRTPAAVQRLQTATCDEPDYDHNHDDHQNNVN
jgi:hypothetical protein